MLLHDSLLNADAVDDVLALFRSRGYRFVSLTEAQQDPAYSIPDTYITKYGPMWGYPCWEDGSEQSDMHLLFSERAITDHICYFNKEQFFERNGARKDHSWNAWAKP